MQLVLEKKRKTMILAILGDFCVFDMASLWRHTMYVYTFLVPMDLGGS